MIPLPSNLRRLLRRAGLLKPNKYQKMLSTGLLQRDWYEKHYGVRFSSPMDAVRDFVDRGLLEGRDPNPYFDTIWYLQNNPDLRLDEFNGNPVLHYALRGWREGRNPSPRFDIGRYQNDNADVVAAGMEPLRHYINNGQYENRKCHPAEGPRSTPVSAIKKTRNARDEPRLLRINKSAKLVDKKPFQDFSRCRFATLDPTSRTFDPRRLDIHWVVPDFKAGAGGHMTIFRIVHLLETLGHKNTLWINNPRLHANPGAAYETIVKHFQNVVAEIRFVADGLADAEGDIVFATDFWTAWPVLNTSRFKRRFYFVQDYEPLFHPMGTEYRIALQTYDQDFDCICAGPWLEGLMRDRHGLWARSFWLAVDRNLYFPAKSERTDDIVHIAFYARHLTARRAVTLGFMALESLAARDVPVHIHFFGADSIGFDEAPFPATDHGVLSPRGLAELYRRCDLGVVFSATNYSLVPQEMMACGIPVVELDGDSTRAVFPDGVVTLVEPHPARIADSIEALVRDPAARRRQTEAALRWVEEFTWPNAARTVEAGITECLIKRGFEAKPAAPAIAAQRPTASVVIPTLNAGDQFKTVLDAVRRQRTPWRKEILVIDSGSTDGTVDLVKSAEDVRLIEIDKAEFGHGKTRNLGVERTEGDFVAFLTHDALPADDYWLYNIVALLARFPRSGGAFGRHIAYDAATEFTKRDLIDHFDQFADMPVYLDNRMDFYKERIDAVRWRQKFHFYSDNNSCMRRSVWEKIPYRDIEFGEDQVWAEDILKAGYGKVYARDAVVFHSHDYDAGETFQRCKTEAAFFLKYFGYGLMSSKEAVDKALKGMNEGDQNWGRERGLDDEVIAERKRLNQARLEGYLAAYEEARPAPGGTS